jgi:hypothetical protein
VLKLSGGEFLATSGALYKRDKVLEGGRSSHRLLEAYRRRLAALCAADGDADTDDAVAAAATAAAASAASVEHGADNNERDASGGSTTSSAVVAAAPQVIVSTNAVCQSISSELIKHLVSLLFRSSFSSLYILVVSDCIDRCTLTYIFNTHTHISSLSLTQSQENSADAPPPARSYASPHPYPSHHKTSAVVTIPGATKLLVSFDGRSSVGGDLLTQLCFYRDAGEQECVVQISGPPPAAAHRRHGVARRGDASYDSFVVAGDTLYFKFNGGTNNDLW